MDELCYGIDLRKYDAKELRKTCQINLKWMIDLYNNYPEKDKFFDRSMSKQIGNIDYLIGVADFKNQLKEDIQNSHYSNEVEKGILQFIQDIKNGKLELRAHPSKKIHAKIYIFRPKIFNEHRSGSVISGSSNLTDSGLGTNPGSNYEFNVELKDFLDVNFALNEFEELWKEGINILPEDIEQLKNETYLNEDINPHDLYYKLLIEYFGSSVQFDPSAVLDLPKKYKRLDYQIDAVNEGFSLLQKHSGFFLSDVVGTGKTLVATIIAKKLMKLWLSDLV
jgi:hypothetical protein